MYLSTQNLITPPNHLNSVVLFWIFLTLVQVVVFSQEPVPEPGAFTAEELITKANAAYTSRNFELAESLFLAFERDFSGEPQVKEVIEKNYALIALCKIINGRSDEAAPYIEKALPDPKLPGDIREELTFWNAILKLQAGEYRAAQEVLGAFFQEKSFNYQRRLEALILFGTCYVLEGYHKTAAEFFEQQIPNLYKAKGGAGFASRAVVLQMVAEIEAHQYDRALALLKREFPKLKEMTQLVSFQTLALQLGSHFMEQGDFYAAIACLQRIWPRERLLKHQNEKLAELRRVHDSMKGDPSQSSALFQIDGTIKRIERELENFEKIKEFDGALRLRLAMSFQGLERYREAALIMEDMLERMELSPVVESASLAVIQCWSQLERWPKAVEAAEKYLLAFGDQAENPKLPQVLFMQGDAMMQLQQNDQAEKVFASLASRFPQHALAEKASFMKGFCQMLQDHYPEAIQTFDQLIAGAAGDSDIAEDAFYWKGMSHSFSQQYEKAFEQMDQYLAKYPGESAKYRAEAVFRKAYSTFCQANYPAAIKELRQFLVDHGPGAKDRDEAQLLLGDALLGEGEADAGIAAYQAINPASHRFFEDGYFKTGQAYKLLGEIPAMRDHYEKFLREYPESKKMPEAVYWIGWTHVQAGDFEIAKKVYWDTIKLHGDNPALFSIEELLMGLPKIYKRQGPDGIGELVRALQSMYLQADREKKTTLAVRTLWADAMIKRGAAKLSEASALLIRLSTLIDPEVHNPQIVADVADVLTEKGDYDRAVVLYRDLRKWNPTSFHKARAFKGLGLIAEAQQKPAEAIDHYLDYEKEAAASTDLVEISLKRIKLQIQSGAAPKARQDLNGLLENPVASTRHKAEILSLLGEDYAAQGDYLKATAYFERVYVVYGKYKDLVAKAYYRRGEMIEKIGDKSSAYEVYAELVARNDLAEFKEYRLGRTKADQLKEFARPKPETEPGKDTKP